MGVFREMQIEWGGESYTFTPSMQLLRSIELQGISIMSVAAQVSRGQAQASLMSTIIASVLRSAGAKASDDDIYAELTTGSPEEVMSLYKTIMIAITPDTKGKKPEGG